ncbi:uncharacterized protein VTP21DRAFT_7612 [Calcarisporiella thermophila]|uniref:uncharacterized protein n=1 Tax=Calcarisporiella thermophila TaxID=911321 RepID=UPI003742E8AB
MEAAPKNINSSDALETVVVPLDPPPNPTMKSDSWRSKIVTFLGFDSLLTASLWFVFAGAFMGFALARMEYYDPMVVWSRGIFGPKPLDRSSLMVIGMQLHLAGALPAAVLAFFQFIPAIRKRCISYHRWAGRAWFLFMTLGLVGAGILVRYGYAFTINTQAVNVVAGTAVVFSMIMGYINIRRKRIQRHREWMLRAMVLASSILSVRVIIAIVFPMLDSIHESGAQKFYEALRCEDLPDSACPKGVSAIAVPVTGSLTGVTFAGSASFIAMILHGIAVEVWIAKKYRKTVLP